MLYISAYTFCAWSLSTDTFQVLHEISIGVKVQRLVLNEKTRAPKPPGWCADPGPQWRHLPPMGSLQTPNRCGCVHFVCLSEWLVSLSRTIKWFACHPQPQGATEGPFLGKVQDWSSIWLFYPIKPSVKSPLWWLEVQTAMMCIWTYVPCIYF